MSPAAYRPYPTQAAESLTPSSLQLVNGLFEKGHMGQILWPPDETLAGQNSIQGQDDHFGAEPIKAFRSPIFTNEAPQSVHLVQKINE